MDIFAAPLGILREAMRAVPSVKYALAVAGVLAAVSIGVKLMADDWRAALIGAICTFLLMVLMVVFARLSTAADKGFAKPILVLTWFSVLLLMVWAVGLTSSVFAGWPVEGMSISRKSDEATTACASTPSSSEIVREATAGEILNVMRQVPTWDRQNQFKHLYQNKHIRLGGWSGTVDELPRHEVQVCDFMVKEDISQARVLVSSCRKSCDFRKDDRVKLFGWVKRYDVDHLEIVAYKIDGVDVAATAPSPPPPPPSPPVVVVYRICSGEYERNCSPHTMYQYCGFSVDAWAKAHCASFTAQRLDTRGWQQMRLFA